MLDAFAPAFAPGRPPAALLAALLAVCALAPAAGADILMRDDGAQGLVFSNREADAAAPAPQAPRLPRIGHASARAGSAAPLRAQSASAARAVAGTLVRAAPASRAQLTPLVAAAATAHGLPAALLQAVVEVESNFNPGAVSPKGALGLMQLMPQTARHLGVADARDPASNLDGGARYLKQLLARFGNNLPLALAAYNAGPGAVARGGVIPGFAETQLYVPRVIVRYHSLQTGSAM